MTFHFFPGLAKRANECVDVFCALFPLSNIIRLVYSFYFVFGLDSKERFIWTEDTSEFSFHVHRSLCPKRMVTHEHTCGRAHTPGLLVAFSRRRWYQQHLVRLIISVYRPMLIGSSAMASSSVAALLPFFFFEYHRNKKQADAFMTNTIQAMYIPDP